MQYLSRRPSGVYVFRLAVPSHLRHVFGKREVVATTGTRELSIAKMVAGSLASQWLQHFNESDRLLAVANPAAMHHQEILKIAQGHPMLLSGGHMQLPHAAAASGISVTDLLRAAGKGSLALFVRSGAILGHLLQFDALEPVDVAMGTSAGVIIPEPQTMPPTAQEHVATGMLCVHPMDLPAVTAAFITGAQTVELVLFELPDRPGLVFAPNATVRATKESLEVAASEVEILRRSVSSLIEPGQLKEAKALQKASLLGGPATVGKRADERLSTALDAYITNRVRQDVEQEGEIKRIKNGCSLLIELEGDLRLADVDSDRLRHFRDKHLSRVPANENKIRLTHGTESVTSSIAAIAGKDWPVMSSSERNKRMKWIGAWFKWLKGQSWISNDPAAALHGESVLTKAESRKERKSDRDDEDRDAFTEADLAAIFGALWFKTGVGALTKENTYREWSTTAHGTGDRDAGLDRHVPGGNTPFDEGASRLKPPICLCLAGSRCRQSALPPARTLRSALGCIPSGWMSPPLTPSSPATRGWPTGGMSATTGSTTSPWCSANPVRCATARPLPTCQHHCSGSGWA